MYIFIYIMYVHELYIIHLLYCMVKVVHCSKIKYILGGF